MDFIMIFSYSLLLWVLMPNSPSPPHALQLVPLPPTVVLLHFCHTPSIALFSSPLLTSFVTPPWPCVLFHELYLTSFYFN